MYEFYCNFKKLLREIIIRKLLLSLDNFVFYKILYAYGKF